MKKMMIFAMVILAATMANAQGVKFHDLKFTEACELAKKENKRVFVDFTMRGCGPCAQMKQAVFPKKVLGDFYNKEFISITLNISYDKKALALAQELGATGYPFYAWYDADEEPLHFMSGARSVDIMLENAKTAITEDACIVLWDKYDEGDTSKEVLTKFYKYLKAYKAREVEMIKEVEDKIISLYGEEAIVI
ncbi:thioredoxin fold domain-containing protein [Carboxylicivirga sp. RSCT41]|uniref:thioredoxin fold domain-containing protein n=1 Tax=Carboxylicivirga agarovorans TaxID=3417570 RepID=UPI003D357FA0